MNRNERNETKYVNAVWQIEQLTLRYSRSAAKQRQVLTQALANLISSRPFEQHAEFIAKVTSELVWASQIRTMEETDIERDIEDEEELADLALALTPSASKVKH